MPRSIKNTEIQGPRINSLALASRRGKEFNEWPLAVNTRIGDHDRRDVGWRPHPALATHPNILIAIRNNSAGRWLLIYIALPAGLKAKWSARKKSHYCLQRADLKTTPSDGFGGNGPLHNPRFKRAWRMMPKAALGKPPWITNDTER